MLLNVITDWHAVQIPPNLNIGSSKVSN